MAIDMKGMTFKQLVDEFTAAKRLATLKGVAKYEVDACALASVEKQLGIDIGKLLNVDAYSKDPPIVEKFWKQFDHLNGHCGERRGWLNHSSDANQIAVNINEFLDACKSNGIKPVNKITLKQMLPLSMSRRLVEKTRTIRSAVTTKSISCWIFEA